MLAIREQHSKVEGYGIAGEAIQRTRIPVIAKLKDCLDVNLHENGATTPEAQALKTSIIDELDPLNPQVAIFVGYSAFHQELPSISSHGQYQR